MPYRITKNRNSETYKVVNKNNPSNVYAYATKNPVKLIQAIEINKIKNAKIKNKKK
jgi:predicted transcriptional regulator